MFLIYTRVSTVEQAADDKTSLAEQERICAGIGLARGHDKMDMTSYSDPGESGSTPLKFRKEGKKLLAEMKAGDTVCAAKLDRMFRSAVDALRTVEEFREAGVDLILPEFGLQPVNNDGAGKLFFGILSLVADFERTVINERMANGKAAKKARGGHVGGLPAYGLQVIGHGHEAKIEVNEREQEMVALVDRLRKRGERPAQILKRLNKDGFKTRTGRDFQIIQVQRIMGYQKGLQ